MKCEQQQKLNVACWLLYWISEAQRTVRVRPLRTTGSSKFFTISPYTVPEQREQCPETKETKIISSLVHSMNFQPCEWIWWSVSERNATERNNHSAIQPVKHI
ncbi:hypothetical protein D917_04190 [Trichinella nativa]|uniref:Uncharacterized protein n=1 Tax=Trichinella nativa TaxID=6335 RepID=A0A1Y3E593_9BILA|nr:hypothetical protein D917_04190 [Trichinella nativa]